MDIEVIQNKIFTIRNQKVMFDFDLAELYQVETRVWKFKITNCDLKEVVKNCDNLKYSSKKIAQNTSKQIGYK